MTRALALLLAPIVVPQARRVARTVPRLPEADGARSGSIPGAIPALSLAVIGDSTAVGTGVSTLDDALSGVLARDLAADGTAVVWTVIGHSGDTSGEVLNGFGSEIDRASAHAAVVLVGWNDAMQLRSARAFGRDLDALLARIVPATGARRLVVVAPPRFGRFTVLPQPLRAALGAHVNGLDRVARRVAARHGAVVVDGFDGDRVAGDGFHPDAAGYATMAHAIADALRW